MVYRSDSMQRHNGGAQRKAKTSPSVGEADVLALALGYELGVRTRMSPAYLLITSAMYDRAVFWGHGISAAFLADVLDNLAANPRFQGLDRAGRPRWNCSGRRGLFTVQPRSTRCRADRQEVRDLPPGGDPELGEDFSQVPVDRVRAEEQSHPDLTIGEPRAR